MTGPKVLIWYWGRLGGGPLVTELLVHYLLAQGFSGRLALSLAQQNERSQMVGLPGLSVDLVDTFSDQPGLTGLLQRLPRFRQAFRRALTETRPDVIVVPMLFGALAPLADIAAADGCRIIYVVHDAVRHPGDSYGLAQTVAQKVMFRIADNLVAMSDTVAEDIKRRVRRVAHKVTTERLAGLFHPASEVRDRPTDVMRFLMPGRLVKYKGYERLAAALRLLPAAGFRVTICGDGPYQDRVEALFRNDPRVSLALNWRTPEQHSGSFRCHDVVLCPYDEASQSAVVCEALSAALPSIVTPVGALAEQVGFGKCGIVLRDMSPEALAAAMMSMLSGEFAYRSASANAIKSLRECNAALKWSHLLTVPDQTRLSRRIQGRLSLRNGVRQTI